MRAATFRGRNRGFRILALVSSVIAGAALGVLAGAVPGTAADTPLPSGTYCQGPQTTQPTGGPTKVALIDLENESASAVTSSPDAPFQNGTLSGQCGGFAPTVMHSITHGSEGNYVGQVSGLNAATDDVARFTLSDCPPDSTSSACAYGGGHFASSVPSLFSQVEATYGSGGWKTYADDMPSNCMTSDATPYATVGSTTYMKYAVRHNPAAYFNGIACGSQDIPSGDWANGQGALYNDLVGGTLPRFSFIQPNNIENGHDPTSVSGVTVAGGTSQIGNVDTYLSQMLALIQSGPDYQSGNLVVIITYDEGYTRGPAPGDAMVGENCADPAISVDATSCQVATWIVGRYVPHYGYSSYMNDFGLLAATQRILGLSPLLAHAADSSTPDIVNGTTVVPDPFNLAPGTPPPPPPPPSVPGAPSGVSAVAGDGSVVLSWVAPSTGGAAISDYVVQYRTSGSSAWSTFVHPVSTVPSATVTGLVDGTGYDFQVSAVNSVGTGAASAVVSATPVAATGGGPQLLPDPGFEAGNGGWVAFTQGTLTRVPSPVHGGVSALQVAAISASASLVGLTQNTAANNSVAGTSYTASCYVQPTGPNLNVQIRFLEYTQNFGSVAHLDSTPIAALPTGVWTRVAVTSTALRSGERMVPQIYSTNEKTTTGNLIYDDCSLNTS